MRYANSGPRAKLVHERLEVQIRRLRQEANRKDAFDKDVVKDRLCVRIRHRSLFQVGDLARKLPEVILESADRMVDLGSQVESRSVLAVQGDEVPAEDHVVADEYRQHGADLHRLGSI